MQAEANLEHESSREEEESDEDEGSIVENLGANSGAHGGLARLSYLRSSSCKELA